MPKVMFVAQYFYFFLYRLLTFVVKLLLSFLDLIGTPSFIFDLPLSVGNFHGFFFFFFYL
jgi:hypothetical protein